MRLRLYPHLAKVLENLLHTTCCTRPVPRPIMRAYWPSISYHPRLDGACRPVSRLPTRITQHKRPLPLVRQQDPVRPPSPARAAIPRSLERTRSLSFVSVCRSHGPVQGWALPQHPMLRFHLHPSSSFNPAVMSLLSVPNVYLATTSPLLLLPTLPFFGPSSRLPNECCHLDSLDLLLSSDHSSVQPPWPPTPISKPNR